MADPIARIPFLGGYMARRQMAEREQSADLEQAIRVNTLRQHFEAEERKRQMQSELAATGGDPVKVRAVLTKYASPDAQLKAMDYAPVGAGGLYDPAANRVIPPALDAKPPTAPPSRKRIEGEQEVFEEWTPTTGWREVSRGPRFQAQVIPPQPRQDPAPTITTVVDPKNPNQLLQVDARAYRGGSVGTPGVVGIAGKESPQQAREAKRQFNMQGIGATIQEAENILTGVRTVDGVQTPADRPTQSGVGSLVDTAASWVGATPRGAAEAQRLKAVAGALTAKMPRMEGPQSDRDTVLYREMAAEVGNDKLPIARRLYALQAVKDLWAKYERLNPDAFAGGQPAPSAPAVGAPPPGAVRKKNK